MSRSSILEELLVKFDEKRQIKAVQAAKSLGWSEGTVRNKIAAGTFPVPVLSVKSQHSSDRKHVRHYIKLTDLAEYLARVETDAALPFGKRRVGRPSKASQLFRQQLQPHPHPAPARHTRKQTRTQPVL